MSSSKSKWKENVYVYLIKKKDNGFPCGRSIGEKLYVSGVDGNPKYTKLRILGKKGLRLVRGIPCPDSFWLHESFVMNEKDFLFKQRNENIDKLID